MTDQDFTLLKLVISFIFLVYVALHCNRVRGQKIKEAQKGINQAFEKCNQKIDQAFRDFERDTTRPARRVAKPVKRGGRGD